MGTNYYLIKNVCGECKRGDEPIHLGKNSMGWAFSFRGYRGWEADAGEEIENIEQWKALARTPGARIKDEYGREHPVEEFIAWTTAKAEKIRSEGREPLFTATEIKNGDYRTRGLDTHIIDGHSFSFFEYS